jgi:hypothetical protein
MECQPLAPIYSLVEVIPTSTDGFAMSRQMRIVECCQRCLRIFWLSVILLISIAPASSAQTYIFGRADFPTTLGPVSSILGDFNGDGKPDLAVAHYSQVSVLLGNGDGTFLSHLDYPTGNYIPDLRAGDFNGDGKLDLAVASQTNSSVAILLGNGDGTFHAGLVIPVANPPQKIIIADFNGDRKLDVATVNSTDVIGSSYNSVSILLGNGGGTFLSPIEYPMNGATFSIAAGDFNGDGKLDLAVGNVGLAVLSILLGNGDGNFQAPVNYGSGTGNHVASSLVIADFNRDGILDVASCGGSTVSVFRGNGDGTFQTHVDYAEGGSDAGWLTAADLNGDGKLDLAVSNGYVGGPPVPTISVLLGKGDGTFQPYADYFTGGQPYSVAASDVNGDGKPDLISATAANSIMVLIGKGDGTFSRSVDYVGGSVPMGVTSGDFNGDGKPDLALANRGDNSVSIFMGSGHGSFSTAVSYPAGPSARAVVAADLNGDNRNDIVVADPSCNLIFPPCPATGSVSVLIANADGTFNAAVSYPVNGYPVSVAAGDFNGDEKVDVVAANANSPGTVSVFLGNGDGTLHSPTDYSTAQGPQAVAIGDVNGDAKLDLIVAATSGSLSILLGNGDGTFQSHVDSPFASSAISVLTADFNRDGKLDIAATDSSTFVHLFIGSGDGTFQSGITYNPGHLEPSGLAVGDFNADGIVDLAVANSFDNTVTLLLGRGDGSFPTMLDYEYGTAGGSSFGLTAGDFRGQGASDLAIANFEGGAGNSVSVLFNSSVASIFPSTLSFAPLAVGTNSTSQALQLTNPGSAPLTIGSITTTTDFSETNTCGTALAVGAKCGIDVTFVPAAGLSRTGTVALTDGALNSPQNVPLTGTGMDFTITTAAGSSDSARVSAGGRANYNLTINPQGGLKGMVTLACTGAPLEAQCSVSPASLKLDGSTALSAAISVSTTASSHVSHRAPPFFSPELRSRPPMFWLLALLMLWSLGAMVVRRSERQYSRVSSQLLVILLLTVISMSCGGGHGTVHNKGTPPGSYSLSVTGTLSTGSGNLLQHKVDLKLTVN